MSKGEELTYEDGSKANFLVNFNIKKRELEEKQKDELNAVQSTSQGF